jgi:NADH-quinone oxidoreductase subunit G
MAAVKALAEKLKATLSGFSSAYIQEGDGDDFLIQDDKAANRAGLVLLGIDTSREFFETSVRDAELFINFNNDLTRTYSDMHLHALLKDTRCIIAASHADQLTAMADIAIPVAAPSEYAGSIINCDNILQTFAAAVSKNHMTRQISERLPQCLAVPCRVTRRTICRTAYIHPYHSKISKQIPSLQRD